MIRRREFIGLLGGAAVAWPLAVRARQDRVKRVGVLMFSPENNPEIQARLAAFLQGLEKLGWSEGSNIRIDYRFGLAGAQMQALAKELVALKPEVILASGTPAAVALHRETSTIPVVFASIGNPIGFGLIAGLARPGGNFTGLTTYEASIAGKWLAMLKEIAPRLTHAALLANRKTTPYDYFLQSARAVTQSLAIDLVPSHVETAADIEHAIESVARVPDSGLVLPPDVTTVTHRDLVIALAARYRLPAVYPLHLFVVAGGLMSYGTDQNDMFRLAASYVDRILRGDQPADLPVQAPTKFETAINLKTAKALGVVVPPGLLVAADEVIE
jgi:ABC-type uncharacterized transport system substrate-binding protein